MLGAAVGPQRRARDLGCLDLLGRARAPTRDGTPRAAGPSATCAAASADCAPRAVRSRGLAEPGCAPGRPPRACRARSRPGTGRAAWRARSGTARLALNVGGIDDGESRLRETPAGDEVQHRERVRGRRLVVLVVGDQAAAEVRGDHLGRREVRASERALAAARRPDQHDEARIGKVDPHRLNTAICVGGPTSASSGPTGRNRTE